MAGTLNLSGYKLTYDDEFNTFSSSPDGSSGDFKTTFYFGGRSLPSNGEHEFYSDSSVGVNPFSLQNGALDITATPGGPAADTSGLITTEKSFSQTYGYFEMRAQLPQGQGMWPAFWLLPSDKSWPPELDPLEAFGQTNANGEGGSNQYHIGMISGNSGQSNGSWETVPANIYTGYHTYGVDWEPDHVTYYFDGQQVAQFNTPSDMNKPMYMLANLAVGGNWPGPEGSETAHMMIDYIRAYSKNPNATAVALQHVSSPDGVDTTAMLHGATVSGDPPAPSPAPAPAPAPTSAPSGSGGSFGTGPDALVLHLSEDAYQGDAQFTVSVDGQQIGGPLSVTALHSAGASEAFTFNGNFGAGTHQVGISFINDLWAGTPDTDRNLYVDGVSFDGHQVANSSATLLSDGTANVTVTGSAAPSPAPAPAPAPVPAPTPAPSGSGGSFGTGPDALVLHLSEDAYQGDAQFTVSVDGKQVGGPLSVSALHSANATESFTFNGNFGPGAHQVGVSFINDLWAGTASTDRNLYVDSVSFDGHQVANSTANLFSNGTADFTVMGSATPSPAPTPAPAPTPTPAPSGGTFGTGPDSLVLHLSEDAYQGNAEFTVAVDGHQIGGPLSVTASHMAGDSEAFTFNGDFGAGKHDVAITFTNDLWAGTPSTDRNLYVNSIDFDGQHIANSSASLFSDGTVHFDPESPTTSPSPAPAPAPAPTPAPSASGSSSDPGTSGGSVAHATPVEARDYIVADTTGTAHGTAGADDIYASGDRQTLIGGGGDDVFHIGTHTDATIVVNGSGTTEVSTWAPIYTLAKGVDNLALEGNYAHTVSGNGMNNYITGSDGNDTINGGGGNVAIQVGTGSNTLTGGGQHDTFVFPKAADHDNLITDFHASQDVLDLRGLVQDAGYRGSDPVADHVLQFTQHGADTIVSIEPNGGAGHTVVTLHNVVASSLHAGANYLWH